MSSGQIKINFKQFPFDELINYTNLIENRINEFTDSSRNPFLISAALSLICHRIVLWLTNEKAN